MEKMHACASLNKIVECLSLAHLFLVSDDIKQVALFCILKQQINCISMLEIGVEANDIIVNNSFVNVNFSHQSVFDFLISHRLFVDPLDCNQFPNYLFRHLWTRLDPAKFDLTIRSLS